LPATIRLGRNLIEVANTLVYYDKVTVMAIKSLIIEAHGAIFKTSSL